MSRRRIKDFFATRPPEPKQFFAALQGIFPDFGSDELIQDLENPDHGVHWVMLDFKDYLAARRTELSESELRLFGHLLNEAVAVDDVLENAVSTVFLEHLHQIRRYKILWPYLSKRAKERTRA